MSGRKAPAGALGAAMRGKGAPAAAPVARLWVLRYRAPGSRAWQTWAEIVDVPRELGRDDVLAALEAWSRWPAWQARASIGGQFAVVEVKGERAAAYLSGNVSTVLWSALAPAERRLTFPVEGGAHARMVRVARAAGLSLTEWAVSVLTAAADEGAAQLAAGTLAAGGVAS